MQSAHVAQRAGMTPASIIRGGRTVYGQALGILMLDTRFPRPPGDVGNASSWPFPVQYKVVKGAWVSRVMGNEPDPTVLEPFVEAARELEAEGVRAITTSCGFLSIFQRELAAAVSIPVLTSALLQVPLAARMLAPGRQVGILTERNTLTERHFQAVGFSAADLPVVVLDFPPDAVFPTVFYGNLLEADTAVLEREMTELAARLVREHPNVGAIVCECTNFVPYSQAMRKAAGVPVFDLYTLVMQTYLATVGTEFRGFL
jgi:aspartate/glutamate racemase